VTVSDTDVFVGAARILLIFGATVTRVGYDVGLGVGLPGMEGGEGRAVGDAVGDKSSIEGGSTVILVSPVYAFKLEVKFDDEEAAIRVLLIADEFWFLVEIVYVTSIPDESTSSALLLLPPLPETVSVTAVMLICSVDIE
jgi:hypothetical protein